MKWERREKVTRWSPTLLTWSWQRGTGRSRRRRRGCSSGAVRCLFRFWWGASWSQIWANIWSSCPACCQSWALWPYLWSVFSRRSRHLFAFSKISEKQTRQVSIDEWISARKVTSWSTLLDPTRAAGTQEETQTSDGWFLTLTRLNSSDWNLLILFVFFLIILVLFKGCTAIILYLIHNRSLNPLLKPFLISFGKFRCSHFSPHLS